MPVIHIMSCFSLSKIRILNGQIMFTRFYFATHTLFCLEFRLASKWFMNRFLVDKTKGTFMLSEYVYKRERESLRVFLVIKLPLIFFRKFPHSIYFLCRGAVYYKLCARCGDLSKLLVKRRCQFSLTKNRGFVNFFSLSEKFKLFFFQSKPPNDSRPVATRYGTQMWRWKIKIFLKDENFFFEWKLENGQSRTSGIARERTL